MYCPKNTLFLIKNQLPQIYIIIIGLSVFAWLHVYDSNDSLFLFLEKKKYSHTLSGCLGWAALFNCGTPQTFHVTF